LNRRELNKKILPEPDPTLNQLTEAVIGAAIDVHRELGPGAAYEEALQYELELRGVAHERQRPFQLNYKGKPIGEGRIDILVAKRLVVELKAVDQLLPIHQAQVIAYLRALNLPLGLLINFNVPVLTKGIRRIVLS
jgi:GxxExxY protein